MDINTEKERGEAFSNIVELLNKYIKHIKNLESRLRILEEQVSLLLEKKGEL